MLFPIVIHQENESAFGITVPDMPGCFSAGDTMEEALSNVREAMDLHMEEVVDGHAPIPVASSASSVVSDPENHGATFFLVELDMSRYLGKSDKINITLPRYVIERIDRAVADGRYKSRSGMLSDSAIKALQAG